jgi:hypothetical protein
MVNLLLTHQMDFYNQPGGVPYCLARSARPPSSSLARVLDARLIAGPA